MTLLHVASSVGLSPKLIVVYIDHQLHIASKDHGQFVKRQCERLGVRFIMAIADPQVIANGEGIEAGARAARYQRLFEIRDAVDAACILTAHTADDQGETVLMRLAQGAGLRGLRGIWAHKGSVYRPWLNVSKQQLQSWASEHCVQSISDPTNADTRFVRNHVRSMLNQPLGAVFGDGWPLQFSKSASHLNDAWSALGYFLDPLKQKHVTEQRGDLLICRDGFCDLPSSVRRLLMGDTIRRLLDETSQVRLNRMSIQIEHCDRLLIAGRQGSQIDLGSGCTAYMEKERLRLVRSTEAVSPIPAVSVTGQGTARFGDWIVSISAPHAYTGESSPGTVSLDSCPLPWLIRHPRPGERYRPFGMSGQKQIRKLWNQVGLPLRLRAASPVIESAGGGLILAAALRPAEAARADVGARVVTVVFSHTHWRPREPN